MSFFDDPIGTARRAIPGPGDIVGAVVSGADALVLWKVEPDPRKKTRLYWFDLSVLDAVDGTLLHAIRLAYPQPGYKSKRQSG
jgi:hypothetical protein